jgi:hypothetical protein
MSGGEKSTPHTSRPMALARALGHLGLSGWQTSVRSIAVPPVERLPVLTQEEDLAGRQHRLGREAGLLQQPLGLVIELELGEHLLVADAAAGVLVHHLDELRDGVVPSPTTWPGTRLATATSSPFDDEHAVVEALEEGLDEHGARCARRLLEGDGDLRRRSQADDTPRPWLASSGLTTTG